MRLRILAAACGILLFPWILARARAFEFRPLPIETCPSSMTVSDDGRLLFVGESDTNRITVWDTKTGAAVKNLECANPRSLLSRGDRLFAANFGKGTVSVFSLKDWELVDELDAGELNVYYLSAPQGKFFKGQLLATAEPDPNSHPIILVDTDKDTSRELFREMHLFIATVDYEGKYIFVQIPPDFSPSATVFKILEYQKILQLPPPVIDERGNKRPNTVITALRGPHQDTPILHQVSPGQTWFGPRAVWQGVPVMPNGDVRGEFLIPDMTRPRAFVFEGQTVRCVGLQPGFPESDSQPVTYADLPPAAEGAIKAVPPDPASLKARRLELLHDVAITRDDGVSFVHFDRAKLKIWVATTTPFKSPPAVVATTPGADASATLPTEVKIDEPVVLQLVGEYAPGSFVVVQGPKGLKISDTGEIRWTPSKDEVGLQTIKIKAKLADKTSFVRLRTTVVSSDAKPTVAKPPTPEELQAANLKAQEEAVARAAAEAKAKVDAAAKAIADARPPADARHELKDSHISLCYLPDGQGVVVLCGDTVQMLDKTGTKVKSSHQFERSYMNLCARKEYLVALAPKSLSLIDPRSWKITKEIELDFPQIQDLALNPAEKFSYVSFKEKGGLGVDETTGKVEPYRQLIGHMLVAEPTGHRLFSMTKNIFQDGFAIEHGGRRIVPSFGSADYLVAYDIRSRTPRPESVNSQPGRNGQRISVASDGKHVAYISGGGAQGQPYAVQSFKSEDVGQESTRYQISAYPADLTFHPVIDMVASTNGNQIWFFRRTTGEGLSDVIESPQGYGGIQRILFAPDGTHLLVIHQQQRDVRFLSSVPLTLKPADLERAKRGYKPEPFVPRVRDAGPLPNPANVADMRVDKLGPADLEALAPGGGKTLSAKEIVRQYGDAITLIQTEGGSGTGFVIGSKGYILTCAHVVADQKNVRVQLRSKPGDAPPGSADIAARVVGINNRHDLALLKIEPKGALPTVHFAVADAIEAGEDVTVIGNPGLGGKILNHTVTNGIVSSPNREFDGVSFIQMSAAVNPGNSGGPMFNGKGEVIGVVSAKARIENTAFAVPIRDVSAFLGQATGSKSPAGRPGKQPPAVASPPAGAGATVPASSSSGELAKSRSWLVGGKKTIKATFERLDKKIAVLKRPDGTFVRVPVSQLSQEDQALVKSAAD